MKGITPVIAVILLLLITIAIVGFAFTFFQRTTQTTAQAGEQQLQQQTSLISTLFKIENIGNGKVAIRNLGTAPLTNILLYADNANLNISAPAIQPGAVAQLDSVVIPGNYNIKVTSGSTQDTLSIGKSVQYFDYDNFEGGPGSSDDWYLRNNVDPDITSSAAYRGRYSLHMPSSWGGNFEFGTGEPTNVPYDTNQYPYMCMAYRIPPGTVNNMLVNIDLVWRSITMTQGEIPCTYPKVASWNPLIVDNQWHHTCINFDQQIDAVLGTGVHNVHGIIWHDGGCQSGITGEFWIDEFIIADTV